MYICFDDRFLEPDEDVVNSFNEWATCVEAAICYVDHAAYGLNQGPLRIEIDGDNCLVGMAPEVYWRAAIISFQQAHEAFSDDAWSLYQVGWCYQEGLRDAARACAAFTEAIACDNRDPASHLALAYMAWCDFNPGAFGRSIPPKPRPSTVLRNLWQGQSGAHFRAALNSPFLWLLLDNQTIYYGEESKAESLHVYTSAYSTVAERLGEMIAMVPPDHWAWFLNRASTWHDGYFGTHLLDEAVNLDKAADPKELLKLNLTLAKRSLSEPDKDYQRACRHYLKAYRLLHRLDDPAGYYGLWLPDPFWTDDLKASDALPSIIKVVDKALDLKLFGGKLPDGRRAKDVAWLAEEAGSLCWKHNRIAAAERFFRSAVTLDPHRATALKQLADILIVRCRVKPALNVMRQLVLEEPDNHEAVRTLAILQSLSGQVEQFHTSEQMAARLADLQAGQELVLEQLSLQRDLMQSFHDTARQLAQSGERALDDDQAFGPVLERQHSLIQEGLRFQLAAGETAEETLIARLSNTVFDGLLYESRRFLVTAETVYAATANEAAASRIDAGIMSVEYAKAVERELRCRILPSFGRIIDASGEDPHLVVVKQVLRPKQGENYQQTLAGLLLNRAALLLKSAGDGHDNALLKISCRIGVDAGYLLRLGDDILDVAQKYRNGSAHIEEQDRLQVDGLRELLFDKELVRRLVDFGQQLHAL